jgi:hypothetical protein
MRQTQFKNSSVCYECVKTKARNALNTVYASGLGRCRCATQDAQLSNGGKMDATAPDARTAFAAVSDAISSATRLKNTKN